VRFVMRVLAPLLCALFGYMPGRRIGLGEDLPAPVMLPVEPLDHAAPLLLRRPGDACRRPRMRRRAPAAAGARLRRRSLGQSACDRHAGAPLVNAPSNGARSPRARRACRRSATWASSASAAPTVLWPQVGDWLLAHAAARAAA
jgi:hypothetical protein